MNRSATVAMLAATCASGVTRAFAQDFDVPFFVTAAGGPASGGDFELVGSIGQLDAGVALSGGGFELTGGLYGGPVGGNLRAPCPGDFNRDGTVDEQDLLEFLDGCASGDARADRTGDGVVDADDLLEFLASYVAAC